MRRAVLLCLIPLLPPGCGDPDVHDHADVKTGARLYELHCAQCHRDDGQGAFLKGVPPVVFNDLSYAQLADLIRGHGRPEDTRMPVFDSMSREEANAIAVYVQQRLRELEGGAAR